jgi:Skp family chaperone for outer membrane proteins
VECWVGVGAREVSSVHRREMEVEDEQRRVAELELRLGTVEAALARQSLAGPSSGKEPMEEEGAGIAADMKRENEELKAKVKELEAELDKAKDVKARDEYRIKHLIKNLDELEARVEELEKAK